MMGNKNRWGGSGLLQQHLICIVEVLLWHLGGFKYIQYEMRGYKDNAISLMVCVVFLCIV